MKDRIVRTCLKCGKKFKSQSCANRICWRCHAENKKEFDPTTTIFLPARERQDEEAR